MINNLITALPVLGILLAGGVAVILGGIALMPVVKWMEEKEII